MRIGISTVGSRGDVQPVVALAHQFRLKGHTVRVATHERYRSLVESAGAEIFPTGNGFASEAVWSTLEGKRIFETKDSTLYALRYFRYVAPHLARHLSEVREAFVDMDVVSGLQSVEMVSHAVASHLQKPYVALHVNPPDPRFFYGPVASRVVPRLADLAARISGNRAAFSDSCFRAFGTRSLKPPPQRLDLLGASPALIAAPADWGDDITQTGFWFYDDARNIPKETRTFLEAGAPPIGVGFGSMPADDSRLISSAFMKAGERLGRRVLFLSGAADLGAVDSEWAHTARDISHHWLLPKLAAFAHHGGAGTTAAAIRAGVPQLVVPHFGDQFFWAKQIADAKIGLRMEREEMVFPIALERAIAATLALQNRTAPMACAVGREEGAADAITEIESWLPAPVKAIAIT